MSAVRVTKRIMSKPVMEHSCPHLATRREMAWRPVEVLREMHPELKRWLEQLEPAIAAFCPNCGELWIVLEKEG